MSSERLSFVIASTDEHTSCGDDELHFNVHVYNISQCNNIYPSACHQKGLSFIIPNIDEHTSGGAHTSIYNLYNTYTSIHACTKMISDTSIYMSITYVSVHVISKTVFHYNKHRWTFKWWWRIYIYIIYIIHIRQFMHALRWWVTLRCTCL